MASKEQEVQKDAQEKQKASKYEELRKEIEEKPEERLFKPEDEFKVLGEKLAKSRDRFLKIKSAADDTNDPELDKLRELRTKAYGEYKLMVEEIQRRAQLDLG